MNPDVNKVSIIIPCFNYGKFLRETLENVAQQTWPNWECLIINDGSSDNTEEIGLEFSKRDSRYVYVYQKNAGMSAARNAGIQQARGHYIQLLDADDFIAPEKLASQVELLEARQDVDMVYGNVRYFMSGNQHVLSKSFDMQDTAWMPEVSGEKVLDELVFRNIFVVSAPLIRKHSLEKVGLFNESLRAFEDWEFWVRCATKGLNFLYDDSPKAYSFIRVHTTSVSQKIGNMRYGELAVRLGIIAKIKKEGLAAVNKERLRYLSKSLVVDRIKNGNYYQLVKNAFSLAKIYLQQ